MVVGGASRADAVEEEDPVRWCTREDEPLATGGVGVDEDVFDLELDCLECE